MKIYDIYKDLNWNNNVKNYCARNIRTAFGIQKSLGDAYEWLKYCDKKVGEIGEICVIGKGIMSGEGGKYGHVCIIIDKDKNRYRVYDGPNSYNFWIDKSKVGGIISLEKMIELGSNVNFKTLKEENDLIINNKNMGEFETLFRKNYKDGTIYNKVHENIDKLSKDNKEMRESLYFIQIGLERLKNTNTLL